jgi:nicotinate phosphoribosyltransferase
LDEAGLRDVKIYASSGFDEFEIDELLNKGAAIDAFGVGTKVGVSADAPYLDIVYKLVEFDGRNVRKLSPGKVTLAGDKQIFREMKDGKMAGDVIGLRKEIMAGRRPLLIQVMHNGKCLVEKLSLEDIQSNFKENFDALPEQYKSIYEIKRFPVRLSDRLIEVQKDM